MGRYPPPVEAKLQAMGAGDIRKVINHIPHLLVLKISVDYRKLRVSDAGHPGKKKSYVGVAGRIDKLLRQDVGDAKRCSTIVVRRNVNGIAWVLAVVEAELIADARRKSSGQAHGNRPGMLHAGA